MAVFPNHQQAIVRMTRAEQALRDRDAGEIRLVEQVRALAAQVEALVPIIEGLRARLREREDRERWVVEQLNGIVELARSRR
jgi:hypothetical protein